jgi:hypothetical protein
MRFVLRLVAAGLIAGLVSSCATGAKPTDSSSLPARGSSTLPPTAAPTPTQPIEVTSGPPYAIVYGHQAPGTIIFGDLVQGGIAPFAGYPLSFTIDRTWSFGAYFGVPIGRTTVTFRLARKDGTKWDQTWSASEPIKADATGVLGTLPRFQKTGIYRLEARAGDQVLATSLMSMVPPCEGVCTGG